MMPRPRIDKHLEVRVGVTGNSDKEELAIRISPPTPRMAARSPDRYNPPHIPGVAERQTLRT